MRFLYIKQNLLYCNIPKGLISILLLQIYTRNSLEKIAFRQRIVGFIQFQDFVKIFLS
jgi:hypothetical protein